MRLDIRYRMSFEYDAPVREAHNELRVRPRDLPTQRLLAHRVGSDPASRILSFTDYWGTTVDHLGVIFEHGRFEIVAEAAVETRDGPAVATEPVARLADPGFRVEHAELLASSPHVRWNDSIEAIARDAVAGADDVTGLVAAVVAGTRSVLAYERNSTRIGIPLDELVAGGRGVCQDYAHLTIGMLRAVGVPARYVSGYLFAVDETAVPDRDDPGDDDEEPVSVQTHAWVEAAMPGGGWLAIDPTNDQPVGRRHVVIGFGRDYDDVAPVRGVYSGAGVPEVEATVEIRRMEPVERTMTARPRRRSRQGQVFGQPILVDHFDAQAQQQQ